MHQPREKTMITTKSDITESKLEEKELLALYRLNLAFSDAMHRKIVNKFKEGKRGWDDPSIKEPLKKALLEHFEKGDMVDVANFAMFIWNIEH